MNKAASNGKLVAGVFGFGGCFGCQLQLLKLEDFPEVCERVEFKEFALTNEEGGGVEGLDVAFVEGGVLRREHEKELKLVREGSKFLVALGSCSCDGGIPAQKSFLDEGEVERLAFGGKARELNAVSPRPIDEFVVVDYYLRGCPVERTELHRVLKDLVHGKTPKPKYVSVCMECKIKENACFLDKGIPCMGPVSAGGCNALCPSHNMPCENCRGPFDDANLEAFELVLRNCGLSEEQVKQKIIRFAGRSKRFKDYCRLKGWIK
ncbi:MAG: hypothetical protein ACP5O3_00200 [Candidatus Micrarchaeia archaeon]|jgi:coenzyme F420-reducing hydrogenase gamma subunit